MWTVSDFYSPSQLPSCSHSLTWHTTLCTVPAVTGCNHYIITTMSYSCKWSSTMSVILFKIRSKLLLQYSQCTALCCGNSPSGNTAEPVLSPLSHLIVLMAKHQPLSSGASKFIASLYSGFENEHLNFCCFCTSCKRNYNTNHKYIVIFQLLRCDQFLLLCIFWEEGCCVCVFDYKTWIGVFLLARNNVHWMWC